MCTLQEKLMSTLSRGSEEKFDAVLYTVRDVEPLENDTL